jgi:hypothetical protein
MHSLILLADAAAQPVWLTLLAAALPLLIPALVALHPLMKLGAFMHAKALDANRSAMAKSAFLGAESLAKSLDHFLELSGQDVSDLADPAKRQAALKHLEDNAKSSALPAAADAVKAFGSSWLTGAASQAIDAAMAKADPAPAGPQTP